MSLCLSFLVTIVGAADDVKYTAKVLKIDNNPVVSFIDGTSDFRQVFNPSWIVGNPGTSGLSGLLIRTQDCGGCGTNYTFSGHTNGCTTRPCCCRCQNASVMTFAKLMNNDNSSSTTPVFEKITKDSIVFGPESEIDERGTEDPRVAFDPRTQTYYMFYTCLHATKGGSLCLATTKNPTIKEGWTRHGEAFPGKHKSGALLIRDEPPHFLISGAGQIFIAESDNLLNWTLGEPFINQTKWGNPKVEAGPPPLKLTNGHYVFFHNSWNGSDSPPPGYEPTFVILDGQDPKRIIAAGDQPLWHSVDHPWTAGVHPYTCNVPQVSFLEAVHTTDKPNVFRMYFGGSDAVVGSALVEIEIN
eukprot:m.202389 g.202389  ORF g.202389 m.202389 type:complete len:357 (-) comp15751_c0_seq3:2331-3401(-)